MTEPSRTAVGVAALRAAHLLFDAPPPILDDTIAIRLLDPETRVRLEGARAEAARPFAVRLRSHVIVRSRFAEDCLADVVAGGTTQYVVLGAGLDTFAWRQPAWASTLRIFEVDQPASQHDKLARLNRAQLPRPSNVILVPVDFEHDQLDVRLAAAGFDPSRAAFFSWLGVTPYLPEPAIDQVLRVITPGPAKVEVVLTFAPAEDGESPSIVEQLAASVGEVFRSHFTPESLERKLRAFGFRDVSFLTPELAQARYFSDRADGLRPPRRTSIARARL